MHIFTLERCFISVCAIWKNSDLLHQIKCLLQYRKRKNRRFYRKSCPARSAIWLKSKAGIRDFAHQGPVFEHAATLIQPHADIRFEIQASKQYWIDIHTRFAHESMAAPVQITLYCDRMALSSANARSFGVLQQTKTAKESPSTP